MWALIIAIWGICYVVFRGAHLRERSMPLDNLPVMFSLVFLIYGTLPAIVWSLQGGENQKLVGYRLGRPPTTEEHAFLLLLGLVFCTSLAFGVWLYQRSKPSLPRTAIGSIPKSVLNICILLVVADFSLTVILTLTGVMRQADSYVDNYLVVQQLPLILRMILKILGGFAFFSKMVILVWLFQHWHTHRLWVYAIIAVTLVSFDPQAGRSGTFLMLLSCLILWNRFVKPLTIPQMTSAGLALLTLFTLAGAYRGLAERGQVRTQDLNLSLGEFDAPWTNAIELYREKRANRLDIPLQLHFSELYNPVPAVFLPFKKWGYSGWFLNEYYFKYGRAGGGLMFGLFAQLVVGFGWADIVFRGVLLGMFLSWITNHLRNGGEWWHYPALVYCAVWTFYSLRDSSFSILTNLIQVIALAVITIQILSGLKVSDLRLFHTVRAAK